MNRTLMFGIAIFLALIGFTLLGGQDNAAQAHWGWGCHGCFGGYGCYGCYGGWGGCYGCYGCFGGYGCHGCYGCFGCYGGYGGVTYGSGAVYSSRATVPYRTASTQPAKKPVKKADRKPLSFRSVSFSR